MNVPLQRVIAYLKSFMVTPGILKIFNVLSLSFFMDRSNEGT